ncbi:hypothetical protein KGQ71_04595, partial [Patescibacteria group bacterium]|nr:hypothetical protein [Patescibacteria group bacterium]
ERLKTVLHLQDGQIATHTATQPFTFLQANTALDIAVSGQTIGQMGHLRADIIQNAKIRSAHTVVFLAVDLDILLALPKIHHSYRPEWQFPSVERDMTVVLPEDTTAHAVLDLLSATDIRQEWEITGIYRGQPLDRDQKSITVHFTYNGLNRTLSDEEVAADQKQLAHLFRQKLSAHITE